MQPLNHLYVQFAQNHNARNRKTSQVDDPLDAGEDADIILLAIRGKMLSFQYHQQSDILMKQVKTSSLITHYQ